MESFQQQTVHSGGFLNWGFSLSSQTIPLCPHWHYFYLNWKKIHLQNNLTVYFVTANYASVSTGNKSWTPHGISSTVNIHCHGRLISFSLPVHTEPFKAHSRIMQLKNKRKISLPFLFWLGFIFFFFPLMTIFNWSISACLGFLLYHSNHASSCLVKTCPRLVQPEFAQTSFALWTRLASQPEEMCPLCSCCWFFKYYPV